MNKESFFNPVFTIALIIVLIFVGLGVIMPEAYGNAMNSAFNFLVGNFGWFYVLTMSTFVAFSLYVMFSKYGKIKLGDPEDKPEYSLVSWFGMLFSAGMGVGLIFYGVAEPLFHYISPISTIEGGTAAA